MNRPQGACAVGILGCKVRFRDFLRRRLLARRRDPLPATGAGALPVNVRLRASRPVPPPRCRQSGSAPIEFISMVPFVLIMMGLIWDLREYVSHRTELAREMYVVAEVIANEVGPSVALTSPTSSPSPIEAVIEQAKETLEGRGAGGVRSTGSAGRISVALVVRGDRRFDPTAAAPHPDCSLDTNPCLPRISHIWPPAGEPEKGRWNGGGDCNNSTQVLDHPSMQLPGPGEHFPLDRPVLPNEIPTDGSPPPPHEEWLSRNLRQQEWWVLVDTCFHSDAGLFGGMVLRGLDFFNVADAAPVLRRRAAWGSVHDYSDCNWCPPP